MSDLAVEVARIGEQARTNEKRIDDHEDICAERYSEISGSFVRVHDRLDRIMVGVIALLISILLSMIAGGVTLLIRAL